MFTISDICTWKVQYIRFWPVCSDKLKCEHKYCQISHVCKTSNLCDNKYPFMLFVLSLDQITDLKCVSIIKQNEISFPVFESPAMIIGQPCSDRFLN